MSAVWQVQQWLYATLTTALAGQGAGGADVPVFDHVPPPAALGGARHHCRIDITAFERRLARGAQDIGGVVSFSVHVFEQAGAGRGRREVYRLNEIVAATLRGQQPIAGGGLVRLQREFVFNDEDTNQAHGVVSCALTV